MMTPTMYCENCGSACEDKFCSNCGFENKPLSKNTKTRTKTTPQSEASTTEKLEPTDNLSSKPNVLNYVSLGAVGVLLLGGIVYASTTEQKIKDLEDRVYYLETEITYTQDWAYDELDSLAQCFNEYADAFDWNGFSWSYCLSPNIP